MEFIKDQEKRILLSAISREKKVIKEHPELAELIPVIEQLDYYFMYDRLFKKIYNQALEDFINKVCSLRIYDNDLTLTDLEEVRKQLMK